MVSAKWNGKVIAESNATIVVEGNHYFPAESVNFDYLKNSSHTSTCPWKGHASYYSLVVDGKENPDAAWTYHDPKSAASEIKDYVAFWRGVEVG